MYMYVCVYVCMWLIIQAMLGLKMLIACTWRETLVVVVRVSTLLSDAIVSPHHCCQNLAA